jgi:hypothetical protein
MERACFLHERSRKYVQKLSWKTLIEETTWGPKHKCGNNIKINFRKVVYEDLKWIELA